MTTSVSYDSEIRKISEDISYLKQDMSKVGTLVERLDTTIDKLTQVSYNVSQLLAVHESKLTAQESFTKQTAELVEKRRVETEEKLQLIHARISSGEKELQVKIDEQYDEILEEIKGLRNEATTQHKEMNGRMTRLERWMWIIVGGGTVVAFILNNGLLVKIFGH